MDELEKRIFSGGDSPLDGKDDLFEVIHNFIEKQVYEYTSPSADRCFVMMIEAEVAMLYRLSEYFCNIITKPTDVMLWRFQVLEFFDSETAKRGDTDKVKNWCEQIEANFDRLINLLNRNC